MHSKETRLVLRFHAQGKRLGDDVKESNAEGASTLVQRLCSRKGGGEKRTMKWGTGPPCMGEPGENDPNLQQFIRLSS